MWGPSFPRLPDNDLDIMRDALEDPNYDPSSPEPYKGLWRWEDGRVATPQEVEDALNPEGKIIREAANEMKKEIDNEIMKDLMSAAQANPIPDPFFPSVGQATPRPPRLIANAIDQTPAPDSVKNEFRRIWSQLP